MRVALGLVYFIEILLLEYVKGTPERVDAYLMPAPFLDGHFITQMLKCLFLDIQYAYSKLFLSVQALVVVCSTVV